MPNISKHLIALLLTLCAVGNAYAQKRTVEEVKKSISDLSADLKAYKSAQTETGAGAPNHKRCTRNLVGGGKSGIWYLRQK